MEICVVTGQPLPFTEPSVTAGLMPRGKQGLAAPFTTVLTAECHLPVAGSVWDSWGVNPFLVLRDSALRADSLNLFSFLALLFTYFQITFHRFVCLHLSYLNLTDRKSSISSSPAINFSLSSEELAMPPSPVVPSHSIDFYIHRSLVTTRLNANSHGNPMDTTSQFEVWPSIITIHATFCTSDITGAQENVFGVVGRTRRLWNVSIQGQN